MVRQLKKRMNEDKSIVRESEFEAAPADVKTEASIDDPHSIDNLPENFSELLKTSLAGLEGKLPKHMVEPLSHFLTEYFIACSQNPNMTPESTNAFYNRHY